MSLYDMNYIRESVDSLCRDGSDTPIVRVHWKTFLTRKRLYSKLAEVITIVLSQIHCNHYEV